MKRDLLSVKDLLSDMNEVLTLAQNLKEGKIRKDGMLKGKTLAMIFEKPSTRTRVSFEVGMAQLGGHALYLSPKDLQLGRGETIADTARVLSKYVNAIMYRAFSHDALLELAKHASVPVINGLDDVEHPCQIVADLLTILEKKGGFKGIKMAYVGDGNNVCNSLLLGAAIVGLNFVVACPSGYEPNKDIAAEARSIAHRNGCESLIVRDPVDAVRGADVIYTDVWTSMGQEEEAKVRESAFISYQVNSRLVSNAKEDCIIMHCLPAHRGQEITDEVIEGKNSVVFDQAENRLHAQQAILLKLIQ